MFKITTASKYTEGLQADSAVLAYADAERVSGGGANVRHGNPGGGSASYNTPGTSDYGLTRDTVSAN